MASVIKNAPFSPAITGALLFALTRAPDNVKQPLLQRLRQYLSGNSIARIITTLKWLFALGLVRNVNTAFSEIAQNNFRLRSEKSKYDWPNEIAVITGATGGFGSLMSKGLAAKGVKIMAVDITEDMPQHMKEHQQISYYRCDITDPEAVKDLASRIREEHGNPSILINNAGVAYNHSILDASPDALKTIFNVNVISHYYLLQQFMPSMIQKRKGHVVTICSMASFISAPGLVPYCNTKAAAYGLHEGLKNETRLFHKAPQIKFTSVHPTFAATPMTAMWRDEIRKAGAALLPAETVADAVVKQVLSGRGRQIILNAGNNWQAGIGSWPHWIKEALTRSGEGKVTLSKAGEEHKNV